MSITRNEAGASRLKKEKSEFLKKLGERIKKIRKKHNLSQAEYACILALKSADLSKIEGGEKRPDIKLLFKIENYFKVNEDWLITGRGKIFENERWAELIEDDVQFLRMFNRLEEGGKKKMLNVIKVFLKSEHLDKQGID